MSRDLRVQYLYTFPLSSDGYKIGWNGGCTATQAQCGAIYSRARVPLLFFLPGFVQIQVPLTGTMVFLPRIGLLVAFSESIDGFACLDVLS